jgi:hypothetical protein
MKKLIVLIIAVLAVVHGVSSAGSDAVIAHQVKVEAAIEGL